MTSACAKLSQHSGLAPLTKRERAALAAIIEHYRATDVSPSHGDVRRALGLGHEGYVRHLVGKLREKGFIEASHGERRAIRVLFTPDGWAFDSNGERMRALEGRVLVLAAELGAARRARACMVLVPRALCAPVGPWCAALRRCPRRRR